MPIVCVSNVCTYIVSIYLLVENGDAAFALQHRKCDENKKHLGCEGDEKEKGNKKTKEMKRKWFNAHPPIHTQLRIHIYRSYCIEHTNNNNNNNV